MATPRVSLDRLNLGRAIAELKVPQQRTRPPRSQLANGSGWLQKWVDADRSWVSGRFMSRLHDPERAFDEQVATRYRLYSGLFLGLPYERLQRVGRLLPVFADFCRKSLANNDSPRVIIDRFFSENPLLADVARNEALFVFLQLVERQVVLFDALEQSSFVHTHDLAAVGSVAQLIDTVLRGDRTDELTKLLEKTATRIVLTAHPTQFYPDAVQNVIQDLRTALSIDDPAQVERLLLQLGKTRFSNRERPTPFDEARRVVSTLTDAFYDVLPEIAARMLAAAHGRQQLTSSLPRNPNLQVGFWPGGDRDGNPFVTAEVTLRVSRLLKERVLSQHHAAAGKLARRLTFDGASESVQSIEERLHVTWLVAAGQWLHNPTLGASGATKPYETAAELLDDLLALRRLIVRDHQSLFVEQVNNFILKVHLFGFHFASIDLRQSSDIFFSSLREGVEVMGPKLGLGRPARDALESSEAAESVPLRLLEQLARLGQALPVECYASLSPLAKDTLEVLRLVPDIQRSNGSLGLHRVIVSHTRSAQDVLVVQALAQFAGVEEGRLDIVPLFESVEDLEQADRIMSELLDSPCYSELLERRHRRQVVMVGFSDGTKDGGYLTANWSIRKAKRRLTALGRSRNVELVFFDGRGGPPARGGGNTHRFYRSRDASIEQLETQLTIQGQTISSNFANPEMARYHVEQLYTANLENLLFPAQTEDPAAHFVPLLDEMSSIAFDAYRALRDDPMLIELLDAHSPLPLFDYLTIASRPVSRRASPSLELATLRAIPFVATWSVMKIQISGFFGLGTALQSLIDSGREQEIVRLYRASQFFRALLDNAAMSLLKSRFDVSAHLEHDERVGPLWRRIRDEAATVERCIQRISHQPCLLANDPLVRASIEFREGIVLPLLVIVHDAFARYNEYRANGTLGCAAAAESRRMALKGIAAVINATRNAA